MAGITLVLLESPDVPLEASCVRADAFASLAEAEIARLEVWQGNRRAALGDFFDVHGSRSSEVRVCGDTARVKRLGAGMAGGALLIEGNAGTGVGEGMSGGRVRVEGDAGDGAGAEMRGGVLEVRGRVGDRAGSGITGGRGMSGGTLIAHGGAGAFTGHRMRRGVIAVGGNAGEYTGAGMIAGTIVVLGDTGRRPGIGSKRGTIVVHGAVEPPPTYRYACTYAPAFVRLYMSVLRERYGLARGSPPYSSSRGDPGSAMAGSAVPDGAGDGVYRRYTGDYAALGKGEILAWTGR